MALLSREAILSAPVPTREVEVPEWGGVVRIRALSAKSRVQLLDAIYLNEKSHEAWKEDQLKPEGEREGVERVEQFDQTLLALLYGIVDETGALLFDLEDYAAFTELDYPTMTRLWAAMSDLTNPDMDAEKKVPVKRNAAVPLPPRGAPREDGE